MQMFGVNSSNIAAIGYEGNTLRVQFNNGRTYEYNDVPDHVIEGLTDADSKGQYFNAFIKNQYPTQEV